MSGSWDRPSPQNRDDREPSWPAEDIESPRQQPPSDPWSAEDPWQERRDSSAWDAWPSVDETTYQPDLPTSDPWAESWADDEGPAVPSEPEGEAAPSRDEPSSETPHAFESPVQEPPAAVPMPPSAAEPAYELPAYEVPAHEPPAYEPSAYEAPAYEAPADEAPAYEPVASEPQPVADMPEAVAPPDEAEPEVEEAPPTPFAATTEAPDEAPAAGAPHIEPWSPDADPWGIGAGAWAPVVPPETEAAAVEPVVPERPEGEPVVAEAAAEPAEPVPAEVAAETAEPVRAEVAAETAEPVAAEVAAETAEPVTAEVAVDEGTPGEPAPSGSFIVPTAGTEPPVDLEPVEETPAVEPEPDEIDADEPAPDWVATPGPIFGTAAAAPAVGLAPPAEPVEPVTPAESAPAEEPATAAEPAPADEPETSGETADEPDAGDRVGGAGLAALAAGAMAAPEAVVELPKPEPEERHQPPWAAALFGDEPPASDGPEFESAPASRAEPLDEAWPQEGDDEGLPPVGDHTQVFPSDWAPPPVTAREGRGELEPAAATVRTSLADPDAAEAPSTAEQAVPWLIGLILLLAGMVIVLLALIFAGDASLGGAAVLPSGSGEPSPSLMAGELVSPSAAASRAPATSAGATATPVPAPQYGALEMVYQGRAAALAPIYLLHRDFTIDEDPGVLAQDANLDVHRHAWSADGRVGAGLLSDVLVSIEPGKEKRRLGDGISTLTFGEDASTVYAVRVTEDGGNDVASVLAINFTSGDTEEVASVSYARPSLKDEAALREAQFLDDGGTVRIFWMDDGTLLLYSTGAGTWSVDPATGEATKVEDHLPLLWSTDGHHHITIIDEDGSTTMSLINGAGAQLATTTIEGLVSHLRWSPDGERVVFTVGHSASGGGVLQDLYLWDLMDGQAPMQLTSTGAAFGAEWLGTAPHWAAAE